MTRRPYLTPYRLSELARELTTDERSILGHLATMRLATASQLQTLHGVAGEAAVRRFRRLLARMTERRLIGRLERQIGGVRAGSAGFVYRLDLAGQRLLDPSSPGRRPWTPRPSWLAHALTVSQLYVDLAARPDTKLMVFEAEPVCWRPFTGGFGPGQQLKPDAYLELAVGDDELLAYVEIDQGTESPATINHKLDTYYRFWQSGGADLTSGVMPLVLWAVPDRARQKSLQGLVQRQSNKAPGLHLVWLQDEVVGRLAEGLGSSPQPITDEAS